MPLLTNLQKNIPFTAMMAVALTLSNLVASPNLARAQDYQGCPVDRPCFNGYRQAGDKVIFRFTGVNSWDFYNVRFAKVGGGEKQVENRSGSFTLTGVRPGRIYTINVQGCNSHVLSRSTCSPWVAQSVTTR